MDVWREGLYVSMLHRIPETFQTVMSGGLKGQEGHKNYS